MSTERDAKNHTLVFECDSCGECAEDAGVYDQHDFNAAWNELKSLGWTAKPVGHDWTHACPKCSSTSSRDIARRFFEG